MNFSCRIFGVFRRFSAFSGHYVFSGLSSNPAFRLNESGSFRPRVVSDNFWGGSFRPKVSRFGPGSFRPLVISAKFQ